MFVDFLQRATLPETNIAPENGWLEDNPFLLGWPFFQVRTVSSQLYSIFCILPNGSSSRQVTDYILNKFHGFLGGPTSVVGWLHHPPPNQW